jgi:hypothetical protein
MREAWEWIVRDDPQAPMPDWASRLALTRFTVEPEAASMVLWVRRFGSG